MSNTFFHRLRYNQNELLQKCQLEIGGRKLLERSFSSEIFRSHVHHARRSIDNKDGYGDIASIKARQCRSSWFSEDAQVEASIPWSCRKRRIPSVEGNEHSTLSCSCSLFMLESSERSCCFLFKIGLRDVVDCFGALKASSILLLSPTPAWLS